MPELRRLAAAAAMCVLALPGCGYGEAEGNSSALSPAETRAEYWEEAKKLTLAPGWDWPPDTPEGTGILDTDPDDGAGNVYGKGYGRTWAGDYWFCSWKSRVISPDVSEHQRKRALAEASKVRTTHMYRNSLDEDGQQAEDQMLSKAELGDLADMRADVRLNCPEANK